MRRWDQIASLVGIALGVLLVFSSLGYNLGRWNEPGPGFMPLGAGLLIIILCVAYGVQSTLVRTDDYRKREGPWPRKNLGKIIGVLIALFIFTFLLSTLGYLLSTFVLMMFLNRVLEAERWFITLFKSALSVLITYIVFGKLLMVQFPQGFLGI